MVRNWVVVIGIELSGKSVDIRGLCIVDVADRSARIDDEEKVLIAGAPASMVVTHVFAQEKGANRWATSFPLVPGEWGELRGALAS